MYGMALGYLAGTAEDLYWNSLGLASGNNLYEPGMTKEDEEYKSAHPSKIDRFFNKFFK